MGFGCILGALVFSCNTNRCFRNWRVGDDCRSIVFSLSSLFLWLSPNCFFFQDCSIIRNLLLACLRLFQQQRFTIISSINCSRRCRYPFRGTSDGARHQSRRYNRRQHTLFTFGKAQKWCFFFVFRRILTKLAQFFKNSSNLGFWEHRSSLFRNNSEPSWGTKIGYILCTTKTLKSFFDKFIQPAKKYYLTTVTLVRASPPRQRQCQKYSSHCISESLPYDSLPADSIFLAHQGFQDVCIWWFLHWVPPSGHFIN